MISTEEIQSMVKSHIDYLEEIEKDFFILLPKKARVLNSSSIGTNLGYLPGDMKTETGRAYPHYRLMLLRTVFRPEPILIDSKPYYLEIKGYGANGRSIFPTHHCEGDLHFGMYLETAQREYDYLTLAHSLDPSSPIPIALLEFPEEEFMRAMLHGVAEILEGRIEEKLEDGRYMRLLQRELEEYELIVQQFLTQWKQDGLLELEREISDRIKKEHPWYSVEFSKITKPAGYLVRATKIPLRLCFAKDHGVSQEDAEEAAFNAGKTYNFLINAAVLHHVPSQGNITLAGELTDYEDATAITDHREIRKSWEFMAKTCPNEGWKITTFHEYLSFTLDEFFLKKK